MKATKDQWIWAGIFALYRKLFRIFRSVESSDLLTERWLSDVEVNDEKTQSGISNDCEVLTPWIKLTMRSEPYLHEDSDLAAWKTSFSTKQLSLDYAQRHIIARSDLYSVNFHTKITRRAIRSVNGRRRPNFTIIQNSTWWQRFDVKKILFTATYQPLKNDKTTASLSIAKSDFNHRHFEKLTQSLC